MEDDSELARAFAARRAWAYDAAYAAYRRTLFAAAYGVLRDEEDAADCVHDVLLRLWREGSGYRVERGSLRAFLAVCARNEALSRARNARNRARIAATLDVQASVPDAATAVADRESLKHALQALNDDQRATVELAYYRHLTHSEIAAQTGEPVGTVKSRLSSALRRLRDAFGAEESTHARR